MKLNRIFIILFILSVLCNIAFFISSYYKESKNNEIYDTKYHVESAQVKKVVDGDTIHVYTHQDILKIRLYGIDCMETNDSHRAHWQAYTNNMDLQDVIKSGIKAKNKLKEIIKQNQNEIYFKTITIDKYGRLVGIIYDKNLNNINEKLIKENHCKTYNYKKNN